MQWLDPSAIVRHTNHRAAVTYNLHAVGLAQPPPTGRVAAVMIGAQVPYLMVEARLMNDAFDGKIPSQGVIVYRVQTTDPHGTTQNQTAPLALLTTTALKVGETFVSGNLKVKVAKALPGGFAISVDDSFKAVGFVTLYEAERVDPELPPGPQNPLMQSIEIDTAPGFLFTAVGGTNHGATIKKAQDTHRRIEIVYTPTGTLSGQILSVRLK
jgi:hypothetical protein